MSVAEQQIQVISERLMKQIIIPQLISDVNHLAEYAPLRQIYYSLILAEYFKRKQAQGLSLQKDGDGSRQAIRKQQPENRPHEELKGTVPDPYEALINSGTTQGLESELPWSKDKIFQQYLSSYQKGEYQIKRSLLGLARMYFSGGITLAFTPPGATDLGLGKGVIKTISDELPRGRIELSTNEGKDGLLTAMKLGDKTIPGELKVVVGEEATGEAETQSGSPISLVEAKKFLESLSKIHDDVADRFTVEFVHPNDFRLENHKINIKWEGLNTHSVYVSNYDVTGYSISGRKILEYVSNYGRLTRRGKERILDKLFGEEAGSPITLERFVDLIFNALAKEETLNKKEVYLLPELSFSLDVDFIEAHSKEFVEGIKRLREVMLKENKKLEDGYSYISMAGINDFHLEQRQVMILMAIGQHLGIWKVIPGDNKQMVNMLDGIVQNFFPVIEDVNLNKVNEILGEEKSSTPETKEGQQAGSPIITGESQLDRSVEGLPITYGPGESAFDESMKPLGGIDLNAIKLELKTYVSSPLEQKRELIGKFKTLLLIDALLDKKWFSLAHLYFQEIVHLVKDKLVSELDRDKLFSAASALKAKGYLIDRQGLEFLKFLESGRPLSEIQFAFFSSP